MENDRDFMEETHVQLTLWSRVALLLELVLADLFQNFPSFETQRFVAMFTKACHWLLNRSQMNPLYMVTSIWTLVLSCPRLRLSNCLLRFPDRNCASFAPWLGLPSADVSGKLWDGLFMMVQWRQSFFFCFAYGCTAFFFCALGWLRDCKSAWC